MSRGAEKNPANFGKEEEVIRRVPRGRTNIEWSVGRK